MTDSRPPPPKRLRRGGALSAQRRVLYMLSDLLGMGFATPAQLSWVKVVNHI